MKLNKKIFIGMSSALIISLFSNLSQVELYQNNYVSAEENPSFNKSTIKKNDIVNIQGTIVSNLGSWGGQGFYITTSNNQTIYVYPNKGDLDNVSLKKGDTVSFTATVGEYNKQLQLIALKNIVKISESNPINPIKTTVDQLNTIIDDSLVTLNDLKVDKITSQGNYKNTVITATDNNNNTIEIFLDNRATGNYDVISKMVKVGDKISQVDGFLTTFKNKKQIKVGELSAITFNSAESSTVEETNVTEPFRKVDTVGNIQGESHTSPLVDTKISLENVVVTKIDNNKGFYVQDITPDTNPNTSDAIYVASKEKVTVGDKLTIQGTVTENLGAGYAEKNKTDLTITQLSAEKIEITGKADLPKPIILGDNIPKNIIDNDSFTTFDPNEDAIDFWESIEGMRVEIEKPKILGPQKYGYLYVLPNSYNGKNNNSGGINLREDGQNTEIIAIMTGNRTYRAKANDYFEENIVGNVTYDYSEYKVDVTNTQLPTKIDGNLTREKSTIKFDENKLTIASYNIENFSANNSKKETPEEKVTKIAQSFVNEINSPDIISLIEVQDNNGSVDDGTTSGVQSGERLANKIKELGGPSYNYVEIEPVNNDEGGKPGSNIRVAYLYNPKRVNLVNKEKGGSSEAAKFVNGELEKNPARIAPLSSAFKNVRKSLAAEFDFKGERVVVITNHLKSKNGDNPLYGKTQPAIETSQASRIEQALELNKFVQEGLKQNPNLKFVLTGDFNDFEFSKTIKTLEGNVLQNLLSLHDESDRYSYFYRGNNQSLDNILVSKNLLDYVKFDAIHVNSSFMEEDGRASDHDPLIAQIDFNITKSHGKNITHNIPKYDLDADNDGDGFTNGVELENNSNPDDKNSTPKLDNSTKPEKDKKKDTDNSSTDGNNNNDNNQDNSNNGSQPDNNGTPANNQKPESDNSSEDENDKTIVVKDENDKTTNKNNNTKKGALVKTGEIASKYSLYGIVTLSIATLIIFFRKKYKNKNEK